MCSSPLRVLVMVHRQMDHSPYCTYVHEQAKALKARGIDVRVISCVCVPPFASRFRPHSAQIIANTPESSLIDGIPVRFPRCRSFGNAGERILGGRLIARAALPIARQWHTQRPFDIVHAHMLPADGHAGLLISRALGIPCALTVHGTDVLRSFIPGKAPSRRCASIASGVDALMAVSTLLLSRVQPYRAGDKLTRVVPNGVDLSLLPEKSERVPGSIISVGTLKARKCMDRTLEAFANLAGDFPHATLTIVGEGEMEDALRARIEQLGLRHRVTLTGSLPHEEVLKRMARSDLFVLPSWGEGYGIVYIEAMAAGCIAVGARGEGIEDTIKDGENGFLVPAGDVQQTERVMRCVLQNPYRFEALRERGQNDARELTWARNAQATEDVYREATRRFRAG